VRRRLYWASFALTPVVLAARYAFDEHGAIVFVLAAAALTPLAFLIGEATENLSEHTGAGIGGFMNASFGNAPELLIGIFAIADGLPNVVRGTIAGSVVATALIVLGAAIAYGGGGIVDRRSLALQISVLLAAVCLFLVPSVAGWHGDPDRHSLYLVTLAISAVLLLLYVTTTGYNLRTHWAERPGERAPTAEAWSIRAALTALGVATVATAFVSDVLVESLDAFGERIGFSQFFVAAVIVALAGNAAEHGGAIVTARRGHAALAAEIAVSSSTQVAVFVAPVIALFSGLVGRGLPLAFRPVEIATMAGAGIAVGLVILDGRAKRWEGFCLTGGYALVVALYWAAGNR
jgi:Ca2+:H+ antiporter